MNYQLVFDTPMMSSFSLPLYDSEINMYIYSFWSLNKMIEFRSKDQIKRGDIIEIMDKSTPSIIYLRKVEKDTDDCLIVVSTPIPVDSNSEYSWSSKSRLMMCVPSSSDGNKTYILVLSATLDQPTSVVGQCQENNSELEFSIIPTREG